MRPEQGKFPSHCGVVYLENVVSDNQVCRLCGLGLLEYCATKSDPWKKLIYGGSITYFISIRPQWEKEDSYSRPLMDQGQRSRGLFQTRKLLWKSSISLSNQKSTIRSINTHGCRKTIIIIDENTAYYKSTDLEASTMLLLCIMLTRMKSQWNEKAVTTVNVD